MLTILLGTDWIANRNEIMRLVADDVAQNKGGRIVMVPEFISHDTERQLCACAGSSASRYAEVLSFSRLATRVSDFVGHAPAECMDSGGRVVAMAAAVRQLHSKLKAYASVETRPEFLTALIDAVDEFKRCCITSADLAAAASQTEGAFAQKLEELSLILESYDAVCSHGKRDPRDQMFWLLEELETSTFGAEHVFYIDGFPDFTRQHMAILCHLISSSVQVTVSLNCDRVNSSAMAFQKAGETAAELIRCAKKAGVEVSIREIAPRDDALKPLRDKLFQGTIAQGICKGDLSAYRMQTQHQECVAAAERIIDLVGSGARYRDISVVCSDQAGYYNMLEMVFQRCRIPAYLSGTEDILNRSVITTVLCAMETALGGFERQDVVTYLKSILSPVDLNVADKLEEYAFLWNIDGNGWLKDWEYHPDGLGQEWTSESRQLLSELNHSRADALEPLLQLRNAFRSANNLAQQVTALYSFFEQIHLRETLDANASTLDACGDNRNAQILNQLWDILLIALEQLYDVLGETIWDAETFTRLFRLLLSQYDVGTIPSVLDAVTVGPPNAMRCQESKHLIVLGVAEGSMPGYGGSSSVLNDQERSQLRSLGVPLTGGALDGLQAEFADIYGVFCGASETVSVSCSGEQPSFLYARLVDLAGGESEAGIQLGAALRDPDEACAYLARCDAAEAADQLNLSTQYSKICAQKSHDIGSVSEKGIQKLYGDQLMLSASQIDRQAECRFSYFLKYGLRAKERRQATVDPAEFGTYVHAVLENSARKIREKGGFPKVSFEDALQITLACSDEYVQSRFGQIENERTAYLFQRNRQELELIAQELWEELSNAKFEPVGFEVAFGNSGDMPAIPVPGKKMKALLRGFVDRVDCWADQECSYFRVVDYKTGKKDFDYCDILNGIGLQMLLYLFALEQEGRHLLGENAIPAGVQYFPARVPLVSADGILSAEEATAARTGNWKRKGLLLGEEAVLYAMEPEEKPKRLPYTRKKDGTLVGDLADRKHFEQLKKYVFGLVGDMVDEIASGNVTPNPYMRGSSHNACTFCPYAIVCHQEMLDECRNYASVSAQRFWEEVEKEASNRG